MTVNDDDRDDDDKSSRSQNFVPRQTGVQIWGCLCSNRELPTAVYFSGFLFWGCHGQVGVQDFTSARLELINVGICGLMNKALHNTCIMHLGEHLQETCAIEVNRHVTDKI